MPVLHHTCYHAGVLARFGEPPAARPLPHSTARPCHRVQGGDPGSIHVIFQAEPFTAAGEGDIAKLAAKLAERDGEVFHHYSYVQQANLGIQELTKQISERFHRASTASAASAGVAAAGQWRPWLRLLQLLTAIFLPMAFYPRCRCSAGHPGTAHEFVSKRGNQDEGLLAFIYRGGARGGGKGQDSQCAAWLGNRSGE